MSLHADVHVTVGTLSVDVDLEVAHGELVAVVGPNGSGKSSLLSAVAGLIPLERGRVVLEGAVLEDTASATRVEPERRRIGMVFQDRLLFPHLTALENVAFGVRAGGADRARARATATAWLERLGVADRAGQRPAALSGGQAQRVALARALATDPRLLLLDEPFTALDVAGRTDARRQLRDGLAGFEGSTVLVTHDPVDALAVADRIAVLEHGRLVQQGSVAEVTARPRSAYVADLVGVNLLRGHAEGDVVHLDAGGTVVASERMQGDVLVVIHPRAVAVHTARPGGSPRNAAAGRVVAVDPEGDRARVVVAGSLPLVAEVTAGAVAELGLAPGADVWIAVKATEVSVYPAS